MTYWYLLFFPAFGLSAWLLITLLHRWLIKPCKHVLAHPERNCRKCGALVDDT